jgi:nicotinamidase-related amidase
MYVYGAGAADTVAELAPLSAVEEGRTIKSIHLSKFADRDANGTEILDPMLQGWGVDTVVVVGSWTEDCVLATAFDGSDRHGYDMVRRLSTL